MIQTKNLVFKNFLSYPDIKIYPGEFTFIVGESGVGKTAFLRMINASEDISGGTIFVDGVDIYDLDPIQQRQDYLLSGQSIYLFKGTIVDNFEKFYQLRDVKMPSLEKISEYLKLVALPVDPHSKVDSMSGGERQRIYLAIFISLARKVIMLDEPTSALDDASARLFLSNLKVYCKEKGLSAIVISHDQSLAQDYADAKVDLSSVKRGEF